MAGHIPRNCPTLPTISRFPLNAKILDQALTGNNQGIPTNCDSAMHTIQGAGFWLLISGAFGQLRTVVNTDLDRV
jgi:hypothetical protein